VVADDNRSFAFARAFDYLLVGSGRGSRQTTRNPSGNATGLMARIGYLIELFNGRMNLWARLYDRAGQQRYAVYIIHVASQAGNTNDQQFAQKFDEVATSYDIPIGFTLDTIGNQPYSPYPSSAGPYLERTSSVLAIHGFASEVFSNRIKHNSQPYDNNIPLENLGSIADWKRDALHDWVKTGVPVILDVSNGNDGRIVWGPGGVGFWGDNRDYTDDHWRNWCSELKGMHVNGNTVKGITVDCWNGYTEGYATVPSVEHGDTVYSWLVDLLEPPPSDFNHMHYINGVRTFRVYGGICEKWIQLGADRRFGVPASNEQSIRPGRVSYFADPARKAIYWTGATGAHESHGIIFQTYVNVGEGSSPLGFLQATKSQTASTVLYNTSNMAVSIGI
jgi:hypothetical protein